ncbi:hypothetical protein HYW32_00355 [Candidatus Berkelbacteria bacterium]|nr:hypothetical protein [Candidatus Berkelbacteria bacterium]
MYYDSEHSIENVVYLDDHRVLSKLVEKARETDDWEPLTDEIMASSHRRDEAELAKVRGVIATAIRHDELNNFSDISARRQNQLKPHGTEREELVGRIVPFSHSTGEYSQVAQVIVGPWGAEPSGDVIEAQLPPREIEPIPELVTDLYEVMGRTFPETFPDTAEGWRRAYDFPEEQPARIIALDELSNFLQESQNQRLKTGQVIVRIADHSNPRTVSVIEMPINHLMLAIGVASDAGSLYQELYNCLAECPVDRDLHRFAMHWRNSSPNHPRRRAFEREIRTGGAMHVLAYSVKKKLISSLI